MSSQLSLPTAVSCLLFLTWKQFVGAKHGIDHWNQKILQVIKALGAKQENGSVVIR